MIRYFLATVLLCSQFSFASTMYLSDSTDYLSVEEAIGRGAIINVGYDEYDHDYVSIQIGISSLKNCKPEHLSMAIINEANIRIAGLSLGKFEFVKYYYVYLKRDHLRNSTLNIQCDFDGFLGYIEIEFSSIAGDTLKTFIRLQSIEHKTELPTKK